METTSLKVDYLIIVNNIPAYSYSVQGFSQPDFTVHLVIYQDFRYFSQAKEYALVIGKLLDIRVYFQRGLGMAERIL